MRWAVASSVSPSGGATASAPPPAIAGTAGTLSGPLPPTTSPARRPRRNASSRFGPVRLQVPYRGATGERANSGKAISVDDFRGRSAHGRGISRRTVATGIAWSVPAVIVASAAPAYASSSASPTVGSATACKNPGGSCKTRPKGYSFFVTLCNPDPTDTIYMYGGTVTSIQIRDLVIAFLVPRSRSRSRRAAA